MQSSSAPRWRLRGRPRAIRPTRARTRPWRCTATGTSTRPSPPLRKRARTTGLWGCYRRAMHRVRYSASWPTADGSRSTTSPDRSRSCLATRPRAQAATTSTSRRSSVNRVPWGPIPTTARPRVPCVSRAASTRVLAPPLAKTARRGRTAARTVLWPACSARRGTDRPRAVYRVSGATRASGGMARSARLARSCPSDSKCPTASRLPTAPGATGCRLR
mmetsp:Transcript_56228/g.155094  ORF Transcript_56228/g.155094 Transcript_56228/m.155094 type:complete len:218 (-) Transcript_56228:4293-4946(-)